MLHSFALPLAGRPKPPALMLRRLRRRQEALAGRAVERLFLAVLPDDETAARIAETARHLRISHGLTGRPFRPEHFHIKLCEAGADGVEAARTASAAMPAFGVCLDRVASFRNGALVLRGGDGMLGLDVLQQRLSDALDSQPRRARPFTPHVTLLHDGYRVAEQRIGPIEWTVREVALLRVRPGRATTRALTRWSLTG
jgi:2'-5' RNA ligase